MHICVHNGSNIHQFHRGQQNCTAGRLFDTSGMLWKTLNVYTHDPLIGVDAKTSLATIKQVGNERNRNARALSKQPEFTHGFFLCLRVTTAAYHVTHYPSHPTSKADTAAVALQPGGAPLPAAAGHISSVLQSCLKTQATIYTSNTTENLTISAALDIRVQSQPNNFTRSPARARCTSTAINRARACPFVNSQSDSVSGRGELTATTMGRNSGV